MNKYLIVMAGVALMMVWSCGGKTNDAVLQTDSLAVDSVKAVADSVTALTLCDALAMRFGTDWLGG